MKRNKSYLWLFLGLYIAVLVKLTFFKGIIGTIDYNETPKIAWDERFERAQLVPFHTILQYIFWDDEFLEIFKQLGFYKKLEFVIQNLLGNLILFLPVGLLVPGIFRKARSFAAVGCIAFFLSFFIEGFQMISGKGFADVDDIILNTIGALLGYLLFRKFFVHTPLSNPSLFSP